MKARETSRDARFLTHLSIETRRIMRAALAKCRFSNCYKTKHCCWRRSKKLDFRADGTRRYQISFTRHNLPASRFELDAVKEEKEKKYTQRKKRETRQRVFKRVLTPRQDREARITAPRVSRNPGLYANLGLGRSVRRGGPRGFWTSPLLHLPRRPRKPTQCTCSTHAGASSGSSRNEFQQVKTRAGGPRAHAMHALHVARIVQVPSSGEPLRLVSFPSLPLIYLSIPIARGLIVSARAAVIRHAGILTDRSTLHE